MARRGGVDPRRAGAPVRAEDVVGRRRVVHEVMRSTFGLVVVGFMACTNVSTTANSGGPPPESAPPANPPPPTVEPTPTAEPTTPEPPTKLAAVTVQMTAATLADDCGGPPRAAKERSSAVKGKQKAAISKGDRACEQSSMQLSVVAGAGGGPIRLAVKKVELFDDKGATIGELTARTPSLWDESGMYQAWDESVAPGKELSVSYALSQPPWGAVPDRRARGYVLKAVLTVGEGEQAVQRDVQVEAPTILPPNVKT